jgi:hypothetical protein
MQRIDVPGMGIVEFPDGMSDDAIAAAIRKNMPAEQPKGPEEGPMQAALIAAGRGTDKLVQGVRQAFNWATGDNATLDKMAADEAEKDRLYKPLQEAHPVATTIGETAPVLAAGMMTGGTSVAGNAATAALPSLLSYGTAKERLTRAGADAAGGAVGTAGANLLARALKPAGVGTQAASKTATEAAERAGYKPTAAQITNNPGMQALENYLLRSPGSSGVMQAARDANQTALNRTAAKAMGETADALDEGVFAAAKGRIGGEFDRLSQVTKPDLSGNFLNVLAKLDADNAARGPFASSKIGDLIDKGLDLAAKGNLDGKAYKEIRTELANQAQTAFRGGDATTGQAYKSLVGALDDAAKATLSPADRKAWDAARKEWAAYKTLTKGNVAEGGNVSAARTAAAVRAKNPNFRAGGVDGELADIARVGEAFKGVGNPNSGQLAQIQNYANPLIGIPMALGNRAAAAAYMSPMGQRYLSRGLVDVGETGQGLLGRTGAALSGPYVRGLLGVE